MHKCKKKIKQRVIKLAWWNQSLNLKKLALTCGNQPTCLFKEVFETLSPAVTTIINSSNGVVPSIFKHAVVHKQTALLKVSDLSAAFDTTYHRFRLNCLEKVVYIQGVTLQSWRQNLLSDHWGIFFFVGSFIMRCAPEMETRVCDLDSSRT